MTDMKDFYKFITATKKKGISSEEVKIYAEAYRCLQEPVTSTIQRTPTHGAREVVPATMPIIGTSIKWEDYYHFHVYSGSTREIKTEYEVAWACRNRILKEGWSTLQETFNESKNKYKHPDEFFLNVNVIEVTDEMVLFTYEHPVSGKIYYAMLVEAGSRSEKELNSRVRKYTKRSVKLGTKESTYTDEGEEDISNEEDF